MSDREQIRQIVEVKWPAAIEARDWESLLAMCDDSIIYVPDTDPALFGKAEFRKWLMETPKLTDLTQHLKQVELREESAVVRATFSLKAEIENQPIERQGFVVGWLRKHSGKWLTKSAYFQYQ